MTETPTIQELASNNLRNKSVEGVFWSSIDQVLTQVFTFVFGVILARLLSPDEFGLIAMIGVFTGFLTVFSKLGFSGALIQRKSINELHLSSVFWLNVLSGFVMMLILFFISPIISNFFNEPKLVHLTMLISITFFIGAFNDVHRALLYRDMKFKALTIIDNLSILISGIVAIVMAFIGFGVWSLAVRAVVATIIGVVGMWMYERWHPKFIFHPKAVKELLKFSMNLLGFRILNYWVRKADNLIIGKCEGSEALGLYNRAYTLMLLPLIQITGVLNRVMFPALSKMQEDTVRVKRVFLQANRMIAFLTMPLVVILFVLAEPIILTLYGEQWAASIPVFQILCIIAIIQPNRSTMGWIYTSQGRTDIQFKWSIISGITAITAFLIGIKWGIVGIATAYVIRGYLIYYPGIVIPGKLINLSFLEFHKNIWKILIASILMGIIIWVAGYILPDNWFAIVRLALQVLLGLTAYLILVHIFKVIAYHEIKSMYFHDFKALLKRLKRR